MKWITHEYPKIDRIACWWLITRFIDKDPEFLFVPAPRVLAVAVETGAVPYDEKPMFRQDRQNPMSGAIAKADAADTESRDEESYPEGGHGHAGYHALSIMPETREGRPSADITLLHGETVKKISEKLD